MNKLSHLIVKLRYVILIVAIALLIPAAAGYFNTRVNYDILTYLPKEIETMQGQDILLDQFGTGSFVLYVVEGMEEKDVANLKSQIEKVDHVADVVWYDSVMDLSVPMEMLPTEVYDAFNSDDATMMFIVFDEGTSADATMDAIENIRKISNKQCFMSGMSAIVTDTKNMAMAETPIYVGIAVLLAVIVLSLTMDSYLIPVFFLLSIGMAIVYNMGTNVFKGEISFITQSLSAVLQLGVTLDYSIFLWHSYQEELDKNDNKMDAMANAISATFQSVIGSSITTVAGFVALCFMSFTLGLDLGVVMAKGVIFGVIGCVTILPSMILIFDNLIEKTKHKPLMPEFNRIPKFVARHYGIFFAIFLVLLFPAIYGNNHTSVYYDLTQTLPDKLESVQGAKKVDEEFEMNSAYMLLVDKNLDSASMNQMIKELKNTDGILSVLSTDSLIGPAFPRSFIPDDLLSDLESDQWKLVLLTTDYKIASDEINNQIGTVNTIVKSYDPKAMVVGEAPCTKDLINITNHDFQVVNTVSIGLVFLIIAFVLKSVSLPFILVAVIEFAIFVNMGLPFYTHTTIPFISSVVIGTIQLGATVDYAILMTTRYLSERKAGHDKKEATLIALSTSMKSVVVSALSFFAATFGVGLISSIDMIGSLCNLMARGAIISMFTVLLVLPAMYMIFDKLIMRTTFGMNVDTDHRPHLGDRLHRHKAA
ncbi:efflux RND transporter permease subunit [Butyrivibrio hungatei]|uniref:RND family transporter n=1 Tax=Butyrivibrio hungatei TaxID=185008 RepID=A0A1D9P0G8_9FIRM|nr:MMPL family transporter [Butyrivibrio hungatei]AOZ95695.1 RND family transporter [Butyrivibrio hungatei]